MAELPEITKFAGQMKNTLQGKKISKINILQEKCTNISVAEFDARTSGGVVKDIFHKGKWIFTSLDNGENILLSFGMGADILFFDDPEILPEKFQVQVNFADNTGYTIRFWWFGKFLLIPDNLLADEPSTKDIAIDPFDKNFTLDYFVNLLKGKKTQIKAFLMNQRNVGGIGNAYMHDILFRAGQHPQKKISDMSKSDIERTYAAIIDVLKLSYDKGSLSFEKDFFGQPGGYDMGDFLVGYKENQPCPTCGEKIAIIKTGSTSTYICHICQKM
ncbi:MAG: hypothetical protein FWB71_01160 [Defluviitaleaceae bacterium]|nr:hypothetical protein [Defluviitaleaceae bacterium]